MNLGANFISKMSKLFGKVGRVDRSIFVQTNFCPYQCSRQVGQTHFGHISKILQFFFYWTLSLYLFIQGDLTLDINKMSGNGQSWKLIFGRLELQIRLSLGILHVYRIILPVFKFRLLLINILVELLTYLVFVLVRLDSTGYR